MVISQAKKQILTPRNIIEVKGKVLYSESSGAWNLIRLKAEFLKEFYQLKEKTSKLSYALVYYRAYEDFEKAFKEIKNNKDALPVMLFLKKEM